MGTVIDGLMAMFRGDNAAFAPAGGQYQPRGAPMPFQLPPQPQQPDPVTPAAPAATAGVPGPIGSPSGGTPTVWDQAKNLGGEVPGGGAPAGPGPGPGQDIKARLMEALEKAKPAAMNAVSSLPVIGPAVDAGVSAYNAAGPIMDIASRLRAAGGDGGAAAAPVSPAAMMPNVPGTTVATGVDPGMPTAVPNFSAPQYAPARGPQPPAAGAPPLPIQKPEAGAGGGGVPKVGQPKPGGGATTAKDIQSFFRNWAAGASHDPSSMVGAFGAGVSGSMNAAHTGQKEAEAKEVAAEDKAYTRARASEKERREARMDKAQISKINAETKKILDPALSMDNRISLETKAADVAINMMKNEGKTWEEVKPEIARLVQESQARILGSGNIGGNTAAAPADSAPLAAPAAPAAPTGPTAIDRKTGKRVMLQDGKWVPAT
jgi:hypothetical protein